ncbi:MAG TPA: hypothetical protein PLK76_04510 [bacterium]|nr:hypothetical protein [bacterium]
MLNTSKDLLFVVLSICIIWLTVFMCWLLYYFISIIGGVKKIIKNLEDKIEKIDNLLSLIKEKIEHSTSYLTLMVDGISKIVNYAKDKKNSWDNYEQTVKKEEAPKRKFAKKTNSPNEKA